MNIRLQYDLEFPAGVYYDNRLQLNTYQVTMQLCSPDDCQPNECIAAW
jgi:hypothetical protein